MDIRQDQADRFDNRIDVMTKTFLGLTVACARCHDHKFDAISTKDYYALFGFLESSSYRLAAFDSLEHNRRVAAELCRPARTSPADFPARRWPNACDRPWSNLRPTCWRREKCWRTSTRWTRSLRPITSTCGLLGRWVTQLNQSARDEQDPLHPWAERRSRAPTRSGR